MSEEELTRRMNKFLETPLMGSEEEPVESSTRQLKLKEVIGDDILDNISEAKEMYDGPIYYTAHIPIPSSIRIKIAIRSWSKEGLVIVDSGSTVTKLDSQSIPYKFLAQSKKPIIGTKYRWHLHK